MSLFDRTVAIVTGAGNGIGRATARALAREGARVVVCDLGCDREGRGQDPAIAERVAAEIREEGGEAATFTGSVATPEGARDAVARAVEAFGGLDVLVCATGIRRDQALGRVDPEAWRAVLDAHAGATLWCVQAAVPALRERGGGAIVTTTSLGALLGNHGQAATTAASASVLALTRTLAIELQRLSIRVNAVAPLAKTRLTEDLPMYEAVTSMTPAHAAAAYVFLASPLARDLSGQVLAVAGAKLAAYRMTESAGRFKDADGGVWSAAEIAEHWASIVKA